MQTKPPTNSNEEADVIRVFDDPCALDAKAWNALLAQQANPTPFLRHEYLAALHASKSAVPATGWHPRFVCAFRGEQLVAACLLYLKDHSYGEYVFDWAWAEAYQRHGLRYYPKLLGAVPFTPVPGTRLMATDETSRALLFEVLPQLAQELGASSVHLLYLDAVDQQAATDAGWMLRKGVQFHWQDPESLANPHSATRRWPHFEAFLTSLQREKRKKIQQERRRVADAGIVFDVFQGAAITQDDWDFFYRCYQTTYQAHHSAPYLSRDFFARMASDMPQHWLMFVARRDGLRIAASLVAIDTEQGVAYGRYWGAVDHVPCLHFEACYYQPLIWCLNQGFRRFEGGAQGEHKMARGLLPVETASAHWLAHPEFSQAVAEFLAREGAGIAEYVNELGERDPFKKDADAPENAT
jgi:predicted N-acyltransferase